MLPNGKMSIVVGGQAGSEAKGKFSGWLCAKEKPDLLVMSASPNAGHTVVLPDGTKKVSYHLPIGMVTCDCPVVLTATSLINPLILAKEIKDLEIDPTRIHIDPRASVITPDHIEAEARGKMSDIGSTLQGIGECRIGKIRRIGGHLLVGTVDHEFRELGVNVLKEPAAVLINNRLDNRERVLCESTQGFDLDLEHGIDPKYSTSKMINPSMAAAEAGVAPSRVGRVFGVIRPYPIRVNNRTGTSGPYAEAAEITWDEVARRSGYPGSPSSFGEITTTTKLPRRVFEFSWKRFRHFLTVCQPDELCLQFANYLDWSVYGEIGISDKVRDFIVKMENFGGVPVRYVGTGPGHDDMVILEDETPY